MSYNFSHGVCVILICVTFGLMLGAIITPISTRKTVIEMQEMYSTYSQYVELLKNSGNLDGNFAQNSEYMEEIISYNKWVAQAHSSQVVHGCFSRFYNIDLSGLKMINLN